MHGHAFRLMNFTTYNEPASKNDTFWIAFFINMIFTEKLEKNEIFSAGGAGGAGAGAGSKNHFLAGVGAGAG